MCDVLQTGKERKRKKKRIKSDGEKECRKMKMKKIQWKVIYIYIRVLWAINKEWNDSKLYIIIVLFTFRCYNFYD